MALAVADGSAIGFGASGLIIPYIILAYDWRVGWFLLGSPVFLITIVDWFFIRAWPKGSYRPEVTSITKGWSSLLAEGKFWLLGTSYLFVGLSILVAFTFVSSYANQERGIPVATSAMLLSILAAGAIPGKLCLSALSDKLSRLKVLILSVILVVTGNITIALSLSIVWIAISVAFFGIGYGAVWPIYAAVAADVYRERAGSVIGLWTLLLGIGMLISPPIAGWMADSTGSFVWSFGFGALGAVASFILLILFVLAHKEYLNGVLV